MRDTAAVVEGIDFGYFTTFSISLINLAGRAEIHSVSLAKQPSVN